ncbi:Hypothetical predicted protein [Octopus vulgaris]|uniref:Uncharacterized protein n=1 Tax=Octopus vulgaris TaxID=6645 RepID=A0AA36EZM2_OCTVU|nr:Hypothetical predicted protein [Octopus vulgaris]
MDDFEKFQKAAPCFGHRSHDINVINVHQFFPLMLCSRVRVAFSQDSANVEGDSCQHLMCSLYNKYDKDIYFDFGHEARAEQQMSSHIFNRFLTPHLYQRN